MVWMQTKKEEKISPKNSDITPKQRIVKDLFIFEFIIRSQIRIDVNY